MSMRTPLSKVKGLGAAKDGTGHFWAQRLTAIANVILVSFFLFSLVRIAGAEHEVVKAYLGAPLQSIMILLLVLAGVYHMYLGMQVIVEDYVHHEGMKIAALVANTFFACFIALACIFSVLKLSFGA